MGVQVGCKFSTRDYKGYVKEFFLVHIKKLYTEIEKWLSGAKIMAVLIKSTLGSQVERQFD